VGREQSPVAQRIATRQRSTAVRCSRPAECDRGGTIEAKSAVPRIPNDEQLGPIRELNSSKLKLYI